MTSVRLGTTVLVLVILALLTAPGVAAKGKPIAADHPFVKFLSTTNVERGREHRALLIYPISREAADPAKVARAATSVEAALKKSLSVGEPEKKPGRGPVDIFNWSTDPILLLAGEVFSGGTRDRFLSRDVLLAPGSRVEAPAFVADKKARPKEEATKTLKPSGAVAPDLLRLVGVIEGPAAKAAGYLEDQFVMAGDKNPRRPLPELFDAKLLGPRTLEYKNIYGAIPDEAKKRTIGVIVMVGDRLIGIELFGSNAAFRAHWSMLLKTYAFQASLYEAAYGLLSQPFPAGRDPDRHLVTSKAQLKKLFAATAREEKAVGSGKEFVLSRDDLVGRMLLEKDTLVHAVVLLDYITSAPDAPPPPGTRPGEYAPGELERRAERARLTEYERRLLERMRERRKPKPPIKPPSDDNRPGIK